MKLSELFYTADEAPNYKRDRELGKHKQREEVAAPGSRPDKELLEPNALKAAIDSGKKPVIINAGGTLEGPSWGDLKRLGYAEKEYGDSRSRYDDERTEERWVYRGPQPIILLTKGNAGGKREMNPGDATDWM